MKYIILIIVILLFSPVQEAVAFDINSYTQKKRAEAVTLKRKSDKRVSYMKHQASQGKPIIVGLNKRVNPIVERRKANQENYDEMATASGEEAELGNSTNSPETAAGQDIMDTGEMYYDQISEEELEKLGF